MTPQEAVAELAEGAADLGPLIKRLKLSVTRLDDPTLTKEVEELIHLNSRMFAATSELMHHAERQLAEKE